MISIRWCVTSILFLETVGFFAGPSARADLTKHECVEANANGQHLLVAGKLTAARAAFQSCATTACPAAVQNDCIKRLDEVDRIQPAIIFEAKDGAGNDVATVTVMVDDAPLTNRLDGTPLRVDPGEHTFVFSMAGAPPVTKKFVLAERDQTRRERIVFGLAPQPVELSAPSLLPAAPAEDVPSDPRRGRSGLQTIGLVAGGVGIVGVAVGAVFTGLGVAANNAQATDCASPANCANHAQAVSDHGTATTDTAIGVTGFVAGGLLLAAGITMFVVGNNSSEPAKTGFFLSPAIAPGSAGLIIHGGF